MSNTAALLLGRINRINTARGKSSPMFINIMTQVSRMPDVLMHGNQKYGTQKHTSPHQSRRAFWLLTVLNQSGTYT
jgi:hypothetical protein